MKLTPNLPLKRCPHCQIANPTIAGHTQPQVTGRSDGAPPEVWATYRCTSCGSLITCKASLDNRGITGDISGIYPEAKSAHTDIPKTARTYLQQAYETLHAPDASAVMAGSAVDSMLKELGLIEGSVYARIGKAVETHILTVEMGKWAHSVRLGANRPRHADGENPHVTPSEAQQSVAFAEALGHFLFVLKAQIERGIEQAEASP